jgi:hypothetical protein
LRLRVQCTVVINGLHGLSPVRVSIRQFTDDGHFRRPALSDALRVGEQTANMLLTSCGTPDMSGHV